MNRKESLNLLLSKIPKEQRDDFIAELREAKSKQERIDILAKYSVALTLQKGIKK